MIVVTVLFKIHVSHVDAFRVAVSQHAKNSLTQEAACKRFDVAVDPEDGSRFFLYEIYDDAAALAAHQQADYFKNFASTVEAWVEAKELNTWEQVEF